MLLTAKSTNFQVQQFPKVRQLHKIGEVGKWNYLSITYSLSNNCTKNYYNRKLTIQVIVEDVVTWIFWNTVYIDFTRTLVIFQSGFVLRNSACRLQPVKLIRRPV